MTSLLFSMNVQYEVIWPYVTAKMLAGNLCTLVGCIYCSSGGIYQIPTLLESLIRNGTKVN